MRLRMPAIDAPLALAALALTTIGLATVYSATTVPGAHEGLWMKQLLWTGVALVAAWIAASIPLRVYDTLAWPLYLVSLLGLGLVLVAGTTVLGAKRWLDLGPLRFQPSEIARIATVLLLARRFDHPRLDLRRMRHWLPAVVLTMIPFALV